MARLDTNANEIADANVAGAAGRAVTPAAQTPAAQTPAADAYLCFRPPPVDLSIHGDAIGNGKERPPPSLEFAASVTGDPDLVFIAGLDTMRVIAEFTDTELEALGRFVPSLLCGEESAVLIFHHESKRLSRESRVEMQKSLLGLAGEEELHEIMLRTLAAWLPDCGDRDEIRDRARKFFFGFASTDPALRLAHIAEIDSCVSITLSAMGKESRVARSEVFSRIIGRIRRDEARHVKICRRHLDEIGISKAQRQEATEKVRLRFVDLMMPVAGAFEDIGLDPDRLFRRIGREPIV